MISNPERLGLGILFGYRSQSPNAHALNYVSMVSRTKTTVILRDELAMKPRDPSAAGN
ncbi:MAG: hypothetical protein IPO22_23935 [Anaerolineales bacterium]|nr:hypothetical protein [Anaerolineales bacterium]